MDSSLLQTKLYIPRTGPNLVARRRLIARLNEGLHDKLTLVSAPAGYGKTALIGEWIRQCDSPVAWLALDENDNDPVRFLSYLVAALQCINGDIGRAVQGSLRTPQRVDSAAVMAALINDVAAASDPLPGDDGPRTTAPFVLVLDDYHVIAAQPIHDALVFLLDHLPPNLHLIIATRVDPPLPIARLRGRGELSELRAEDLRFTAAETADFLNEAMGLHLSIADVDALSTRTEGWIVGLQMAALSMRGRQDVSAFIQAFGGSHRFVLDYLVEEVLEQQPDEIQEFLCQTAILKRLTAPLCDHITGRQNSATILTQLEHANLFVIPLDDERRWYRYHHLFADLLQQRLQRAQTDNTAELHRRACQWHHENGLIPEAVDHALAAEDDEQAADLIEWTAWTSLTRGEITTVRGWLDRLPQKLRRSRPQLDILYAWTLALGGEMERAERFLQSVDTAQIPGETAALRAYIFSQHDEMAEAVALARQAADRLPEEHWFSRSACAVILSTAPLSAGEPTPAIQALSETVQTTDRAGHTYLTTLTMAMLGEAFWMQGRLLRAAEIHRQVLQTTAAADDQPAPFVSAAHAGLARALYEWNDLEGAQRHAQEAVKLSRLGGLADTAQSAYAVLAQWHQATGDAAGATKSLYETERLAQPHDLLMRAWLTAYRAKLWMAQGDVVAATQWLQTEGSAAGDGAGYAHELSRLARVRALLTQVRAQNGSEAYQRGQCRTAKIEEALDPLAALLPAAEAAQRMRSVVEIRVLQALAHQIQGDLDRALSALERALALAEPEGYVRTFVDEGEAMAALLRRALALGITPSYTARLLAACGQEAQPTSTAQASLVEPLSQRELEVLRLLVAGLSNAEIAEELVVAVSTVKSHINHIYGKLDVGSRIQAAERARTLGLL